MDDTPDNITLMSSLLKDLYKVKIANNGEKALKIANSDNPPDLILLDIMMPRMSGFQVCKKLKSDAATRDIQILMVTALNELGDIEQATECGTDDFVSKPVNKFELLTRVKSLLRVRHLKSELERALSYLDEVEQEAARGHDPAVRRRDEEAALLVVGGDRLDLEYCIVGDGTGRVALEKLAVDLGVSHRVRFLGRLSQADLRAAYASAALFVLAPRPAPGDVEGFGLVYLEEEARMPGEETIKLAVMATVLLSIFAHGFSALPGIDLYARRVEALDAGAPEHQG